MSLAETIASNSPIPNLTDLLECLRGCVFFIILLAAFLTQAKVLTNKL